MVFTSAGTLRRDLALTFRANGGVFLGGGIAPRIKNVLGQGSFRASFERKAPHSAWLARIPTFVITASEPGLSGLALVASHPEISFWNCMGPASELWLRNPQT